MKTALLKWLLDCLIDTLAGVVLTLWSAKPKQKTMTKGTHIPVMFGCVECTRAKKLAKNALIFLAAAAAIGVLLVLTGCGSLAQQPPMPPGVGGPNTNQFAPASWITPATNAIQTIGAVADPLTGGISSLASRFGSWLLVGASVLAAGILNKQKLAVTAESDAKTQAFDTVNSVLLAHPAGPDMLKAIQARALTDKTDAVVNEHLG